MAAGIPSSPRREPPARPAELCWDANPVVPRLFAARRALPRSVTTQGNRRRRGHTGLSNPWRTCYIVNMTTKTATEDKRRRTTMVPVTTMEEIPVLSDAERLELTASLKEAETRVKAGKAIDYDPKSFKDRLVGIYRGAKR